MTSSGPPGPRVAIVTGGTGALGQAVVRRLLADGAVVCVPSVVEAESRALLASVAGGERERLTVDAADVTDPAATAALVDRVLARHRHVDVLVAGVGGFVGGGLLDTDRSTWDRMLTLNLTSVFTAARAVVPHMVAAGHGRVVTVGSRAVVPPAGGFIAYTVAKAGVIAFTQALAQETRGHGVTANAVLPSTMDTPANRAAMPDVDSRTWVPVESVAAAIAFLASEAAGHVTGSLIAI
jgi:NAD(P)-dependent dehydrogenase (short-subunit alcohol dehydrogenase family)